MEAVDFCKVVFPCGMLSRRDNFMSGFSSIEHTVISIMVICDKYVAPVRDKPWFQLALCHCLFQPSNGNRLNIEFPCGVNQGEDADLLIADAAFHFF